MDGTLFKYPDEALVIVTPSGNITVPVNVGLANGAHRLNAVVIHPLLLMMRAWGCAVDVVVR